MERRVGKKIENYQVEFKHNIKTWLEKEGCVIRSSTEDKTSMFLQFIYDYESLELLKEDFQKRKRVKNVVPNFERCNARRANGDQCTRRRKEGFNYCGTHTKGTPHGILIDNENQDDVIHINVEMWVQDIQGINYYIDTVGNVYKPEDIIQNKDSPQIIAKWERDANDNYTIPEFN